GAGIDDWGGVSPLTPDHVNPERPWPNIDVLERITAETGYVLAERLTAQPEYVRAGQPWIDPRVRGHVDALARADGRADTGAAVGLLGAHRPGDRHRHRGPAQSGPLGPVERFRGLGDGA